MTRTPLGFAITFLSAIACTPQASLAAAPKTAAAQTKKFEIIAIRDIMVPMRDGVKLATDIYLPARNGRPVAETLPAVLMRTPYDRTRAFVEHVRHFAEHGYMAVTQDCRGRFASEGRFFAFVHEPEDGYDTIAWVAKHKACNGKVGMYGVSYMAWDQYAAASLNPPALATITPNAGPFNAYRDSMHYGGTYALGMLQYQVFMASTGKEANKNPQLAHALESMAEGEGFLRWAMALPWRRGQTPLALAPDYEDAAFKYYFENVDYNDFWRAPGLANDEHLSKFPDVPTLSMVGWYEGYARTIFDGYTALVAAKRAPHFLLAGPWTHANTRPSCGDANFGAIASEIPGVGTYLDLHDRWYDRFLRGDKTADIGAPVKIFIMGGGDGRRGEGRRINHGGRWHTGNQWPIAGSRVVPYYLHAGGLLSRDKPAERQASTSYTYDPQNTVSSDGRCHIPYGPFLATHPECVGPWDQIQKYTLLGHGTPGLPIAARTDVLVFQTEPLAHDVTMAGSNTARLFISSDAPDTDFFVKLIDVYPPSADYPLGYAFPLTDGILRARYRESFSHPTLLESGKVYELAIPIQPVANRFVAGHRIRVDITSSSFPSYEPNRNTGRPNDRTWRIANNTIHHDAPRASSFELRILP